MRSSPLVSVLIPAYNADDWIEETLKSVLAQTYAPCEIIVVDDGSTDKTAAICRNYRHQGVRLLCQENSGAAAARNHALRFASGAFIQFLDADDLLDPRKIAIQVNELNQRPVGTVAAGPWGRFHRDPSAAVFTPEENWQDLSAEEWLRLNFAGRGMMPPAAWLAPQSTIAAAGPWDESLSLNDDGEFYCRVLLRSTGIAFCPDARSYYRSGLPHSLSRTSSRVAWDSAWRSQLSCVRQIIRFNDTPENHQACADLLLRLAHSTYPVYPDIARTALAESRRHGRSRLRVGGGKLVQGVERLAGWRAARLVQHWVNLHRHRP